MKDHSGLDSFLKFNMLLLLFHGSVYCGVNSWWWCCIQLSCNYDRFTTPASKCYVVLVYSTSHGKCSAGSDPPRPEHGWTICRLVTFNTSMVEARWITSIKTSRYVEVICRTLVSLLKHFNTVFFCVSFAACTMDIIPGCNNRLPHVSLSGLSNLVVSHVAPTQPKS